jgi:hypothetical protein
MKISRLSALTATALILASQSVSAESLFRPRASLGFASYELSMDQGTTSLAKSSYMTLGVGATLAMDNLYFDIASTSSLSAEYDNDATSLTEDFSRDDVAFTVGLAMDGGFSVFAGYKTGSTEYSNPTASSTFLTFDTNGLFFGASAGFPMSDNNSLSVSGALAFLNGKLEDNYIGASYDEEADSIGLSLAMTYTSNFSDTSGMTIKGAVQSYGFTNWSGPYSDSIAPLELADHTETIVSLELGFFVSF